MDPEDSGRTASWESLPGDILQIVGSNLSDPQHLRFATMVCKQWRSNLTAGVQELHVDMPPDTDAWNKRVRRLGALLPQLGRCRAHVSSAVPVAALASNLQVLGQELAHIEHLHLDLSDGAELGLSSGSELGPLRRLRRLTVTGGSFTGASAQALLKGLAAACPELEELRLLPAPRCGLGDAEVPLLVELKHLKVLAFQSYRLTSAGLMQLMALQHLQALSVVGLDTWGVDTAAFVARPTLRELHLGCDYELPPDAVERLRDVPDLSMTFRWTDKLRGLLKTCSLHLSRQLVKLDLGCVRLGVGSAALEGLEALQGLTDLRLSVYSNSDTRVLLDLGQLAPLSKLQVLHLAKQRAYFPEQRRLLESNITIPVTAAAVRRLAASCPGLRTLRLTLGRSDLQQEGLEQLSAFSQLRTLFVSAEPFSSPSCPFPLDLTSLPRGLQQLQLRNIDLVVPGSPHSSSSRGSSSGGSWSLGVGDPAPGRSSSSGGGSSIGSGSASSSRAGSTPGCLAIGSSSSSGVLALGSSPSSGGSLGSSQGALSTSGLLDTAMQQLGSPRSCSRRMTSSSSGGGSSSSSIGACSQRQDHARPNDQQGVVVKSLGHLSSLTGLHLESCRVGRQQLLDVLAAVPDLQQLKLARVAGLDSVGVAALSRLTALQQLTVEAPHNKAVTQASLHALAGLRQLRHLTWETDDLCNAGPVVSAFAHFTLLRSLALSCSRRMVVAVCGSDDVFQKLMPYCDISMVQG